MSRTKQKPIKPGMPESRVLAGVLDAFRLWGIDAERQNTGGMVNPKGQYVAFSRPGNADVRGTFPAHFGIAAGKSFACEVKKESFDASKVRGAERERFLKQVAKLRDLNAAGGYGWWCNSPDQVPHVLGRIRDGWRIVIDESNVPYLESPETGDAQA